MYVHGMYVRLTRHERFLQQVGPVVRFFLIEITPLERAHFQWRTSYNDSQMPWKGCSITFTDCRTGIGKVCHVRMTGQGLCTVVTVRDVF